MKYAIQGYEDVTAEHLLGIFGNPIKHTLSPVIHDTLSDALGLSERAVLRGGRGSVPLCEARV